MATALKQILVTQKDHADTISDHELILRGNPRTETPGLIHSFGKLSTKVDTHDKWISKFLWMCMGASSVGSIVSVLIYIIIKELMK